ncbi:MAG: hypothetical protein JWO61_144 [Candidatus Saccharibacteria bacterium]|nr:hypothetical protein [Candidatus Saccharibacteria bacterium]
MKLSRFVNNPDNTPLHSSGLVGEGAPKPQSFTERQQLEKQRRIIGGYQRSLVGTSYVQRGEIRSAQRSAAPTSRQQFNVPGGQGFKEPPTSGFNPYS